MAAFAYTYGWRKSEILGLMWDRVDFAANTVRLDPGSTKNRDGRTVILTADLRRILLEQWEKARALALKRDPEATPRDVREAIPWVFHRGGKGIKSFRRAWFTACKRAGMIGRIPHDFRRTAIRNLERAGVTRSTAMAMVGHRTEATYRRYAILDEAMLREAAIKLSERSTLRARVPNRIKRLPRTSHEG